jgi:hypothetical protein
MTTRHAEREAPDAPVEQPGLAATRTGRNRLAPFLLVALAAATALPFRFAADFELPQAHDLTVHWNRMIAFDEGLRSGLIYPRWLGQLNQGYGAATTLFYAPGVYYALSAAHAVSGDWADAIGILAFVAAFGSAAGFYLYARLLVDRRAALIASSIYILLPYRLIDLYHRGALAELLAFVWMPLVMYAVTRGARRFSPSLLILGGVAYALLMLTHPPTTYLFTLSLGVFALACWWQARRPGFALFGLGVVLIGSAVSAFYWLPATVEIAYVRQPITPTFDEHPGYLTGLLAGDRFERLIAAIAIATFVFIGLLWFAVRRHQRYRVQQDPWRLSARALLITSGFGLLLMTPPLALLAKSVPGMSTVGFLWRWMAIQVFVCAALTALVFDRTGSVSFAGARANGLAKVAAAAAVPLILFGIVASVSASNLQLRLVPPFEALEEAFTPAGAPDVYDLRRDAVAESDDCRVEYRVVDWKPEARLIEVSVDSDCTVELPTFYFPGWRVEVDGRDSPFFVHRNRASFLIPLTVGAHRLELDFSNTPVRTAAAWISRCALLLCGLFLTFRFSARFASRMRSRMA